MAQPYVGEIRMFAGNFPPVGWMFCDGQLLPISENETLFQLIGTTYGGDGESTFALPNLQSRVPIHMGSSGGVTYQLAEMAGVETVTLTTQQIPNHTHPLMASLTVADDGNPGNKVLAQIRPGTNSYFEDVAQNNMAASAITPAGGGQPHDNIQPFQCINYIISLFGIFPSQT
jgi:microcystin-dependent protein